MNFQQLIMALQSFWAQQGCIIGQPYDVEKGAGTFNPHTFLRCLGPEPWKVAYVEPCRRPTDGRYGENPNRLGAYYQFQVILKPSPDDVLERYLRGLNALGIRAQDHDIRFVEDDWESPTLGAWGLGWEVWLDGMEITQFTYFQQVGGVECRPVSAEITYGLERIAMYLQGVDSVYDLEWAHGVKYREIHHHTEVDWSKYNFEHADVQMLFSQFKIHEDEARRLADLSLVFPAYDAACRCSHLFNSLDARGAISVAERAAYIGRIRGLSKLCAETYVAEREKLDFPILRGGSTWMKEAKPTEHSGTTPGMLSTLPPGMPAVPVMGGAASFYGADDEDDDESTLIAPMMIAATSGQFLLEIGAEEIPARFLREGERHLKDGVLAVLDAHNVSHGEARAYSTPRRLCLVVDAVAHRSPTVSDTVMGPPSRIAFDDAGAPKIPARKFAEKCGVTVESLQRIDTPKGEYLAARIEGGGEDTGRLLEVKLPGVLANIPWRKSMRWGERDERFVRPVHWLVCLLGRQQLRFDFAGITSGNITWGHRFFGRESFPVWNFETWRDGLRSRNVIVDPAERRALIEQQLREAAAAVGGEIVMDEQLLDAVVGLIEIPHAVLGAFDDKYLSLPREVVSTILTYHQKMFSVAKPGSGQLLPYFVGISNNPSEEQPATREGYERVVGARLADGEFFYGNDRKRTLRSWADELGGVRFLRGLGSMADKGERLAVIARALAEHVPGSNGEQAARAAKLAKADLCTFVVREFPELQGTMGRHYATLDRVDEEVATALFEHYLPRGADDELPASGCGVLVSLADKIDTLCACFSIGKAPTGSADPYALRRAALGILRILDAKRLHLTLRALVASGVDALDTGADTREEVFLALLDFFRGRLKNLFIGEGFPTDLVEAVLSAGFHDVPDVRARLVAVRGLQQRGGFSDLMQSFKRMGNIVRKAQADREAPTRWDPDAEIDATLIEDGAERSLHDAFLALRATSLAAIAQEDYPAALAEMGSLRLPLAAFFDDVLVMAEQPALRANRLGLLKHIGGLFARIADFSLISTDS